MPARCTPGSFPRSEGRGSIEATLARRHSVGDSWFPRSEGRGSIEAWHGVGWCMAFMWVSTFGRTWLH